MSIVTKTGDKGDTGLMYNRRVPKCRPRVAAYLQSERRISFNEWGIFRAYRELDG